MHLYVDLAKQHQTQLFQHFVTLEMNILLISLIRNVQQAFVKIFFNTRSMQINVRAVHFVQEFVQMVQSLVQLRNHI